MKLCKILHGSRLYGLHNENSDIDFHTVFVPTLRETVFHLDRPTHEISPAGDIHSAPLVVFGERLKNGEMMALECLFAPDDHHEEVPHAFWQELVANRSKLVSSKLDDAMGYCNTNARYHVFDNRFQRELETAIDILSRLDPNAKLIDHKDDLVAVGGVLVSKNGVDFVEFANRKATLTITVDHAYNQYSESLAKIYRNSARKRVDEAGFDWKGLSHVCRIMRQVHDLLSTGELKFPFTDERDFFLDVKMGKVDYDTVAKYIDTVYNEVLNLKETTFLPSEIDSDWLDEFILKVHQSVWVD
ncbi:putative nucleotidyltransferase [Ochrobactrum phage vB_OspM_OC]|nr:putative nucleotidyltransferase [Ochrobactrum phage vB_OspM_OC]